MKKKTEFLMIGEVVNAEVFRGDKGFYSIEPDEKICVNDLIVNTGRTFLAQRINAEDPVASRMNHTAIGTATTAPDLTDTTLPGEAARKTSAVSSATSNNIYTNITTWGGFADGITSIEITEAGVFNAPNSGTGTMFQRVTYSAVTLANSDLLKLTLETVVGSNTI